MAKQIQKQKPQPATPQESADAPTVSRKLAKLWFSGN